MALTLGGPVVIPKLVNGRNKLFFFANYSYVNDFIPGKNQGSSTVPANAAQLQRRLLRSAQAAEPGAVSDLRSADGAPRSGEPEPVHPRSVPEQHHPGEPDRESALQPVPADGAEAESEPVENGTTPTDNYYRGGEPDKPVSSLYAGRVDYNMSGNDRFFFRVSGNTFLEPVSDWTYEVPEFEGLHSIDRSRYNWAVDRQLDARRRARRVIDTQVASNRFFQDDLLRRLHEYKPTRHGPARRTSTRSARRRATACCRSSASAAIRASRRARSPATRTTNLQGTVNLTQVRGAHTLRGGVDARLAQRQRGPRRQPVRAALVHQRVHAAGQRHLAAHAEQPRAEPGGVHAGHSVDRRRRPSSRRSTFATTSSPPSGRIRGACENLTLNVGLRFEWEDGISEDDGAMIVGLRSEREAGDLRSRRGGVRQGADRRSLPAANFHVRGGSIYATDAGPGRQGLEAADDVDAARVGGLQAGREDGAEGAATASTTTR